MSYVPLYVHSFVLCAPRKILEATIFNQRYRSYEEIENVPDRLRRCRHSKGLMQVEVADKVGMTHSVYKAIEEGFAQHIEPEKVDRLAQFYGVPVTDYLDEFNHFLYDGQTVRIRAYRESFGMGKKPFARKMGIPVRCLQEWESDRKVISIKNAGNGTSKVGHKKTGNRLFHQVCSLLLSFTVSMTASKSSSFWVVGQFSDLIRWVTAAAWASDTRFASSIWPSSVLG